jgi:hypothetical protein
MAAIVLGVQTDSTANVETYATGAFTPALNDLLVAIAGVQGTEDAGAYASSDAGKTYSKLGSDTWSAGDRQFYAFVADQLADADSQTGTMDVTGNAGTSCAQGILRVSGMTKVGAAAIRQFKILGTQTGADPSIAFDNACLTGNPTILAVVRNSATTGAVGAPSGWTTTVDVAASTPGCNVAIFTRDSGFTGTTITATLGATNHAVIGIELDASASDGRTGTMAATESGADDATASGAVVVAGTLAATEAGADDATMSGAVVVAGTLAATETGSDTFAGSGTVDGGEEPAPAQPAQPTYGAAPHTLDPRKVYAKYEEIEAIERSIRAKEEAEREKIAALEQEKRRLADLALKKRQTKTLLERRRKLEARIAAYQGEIAELRAAMAELLGEIERLRTEAELQQTVALRRRRLLLAVATAA